MHKQQFYEKALPAKGSYCVVGITDGNVVTHFADTIPELLTKTDSLIKTNYNTFIALNSFNTHSRKADQAAYAKSFFIDLDVGHTLNKYPSKEYALLSLQGFVAAVGLPEPTVVDSGTGIHGYWVLDQDVASGEWRHYANKLKALCLQHIKIDPAVTADCSRIMRVPESLNYKTDPPTESKFVAEGKDCSYESFKSLLDKLIPDQDKLAINTQQVLATAVKGLDDDTAVIGSINPNFETVFSVIAQKSIDDEGGCAQIKYAIMNSKTLPEPVWHSALSIARQCVDWEESIHDLSRDYPYYSAEETLRKANETHNKPHSCEVFDARNPGICTTCPYWGKITNPLALGRQLKEPEAAPQNAVREDEDSQDIPIYRAFPKEIAGFQRGPSGGVWWLPPPKKVGEDWVTQNPIELWEHDIYPIKRMYDPRVRGEVLVMRHIMPHDGIRDFSLPVSLLGKQEGFKELFYKHGVAFPLTMTPAMIEYTRKWAQYMVNQKSAELMRKQMGWTDETGSSFVIGNTELHRNGKVTRTAASTFVEDIAKHMHTRGSYEVWQEAANKLNRPGYEVHALPLLAGLGSPLIQFTTVKGVTIGFIANSGTAKTGALIAGMSLFGDPFGLMLSGSLGSKGDAATNNAFTQYQMGLKNVMMALDESSNCNKEDISSLMYRVTQGKNKLRMQASDNTLRESETPTALILCTTMNQSMDDKLLRYKADPTGEMARYIELHLPKPPTLDVHEGREMFDPYRTNYGFAGPEYIKYLFTLDIKYIESRISEWQNRYISDVSDDSEDRFYSTTVGALFAGGEFAAAAGIVKLDLERIYQVFKQRLIRRKEIIAHRTDFEELLATFQSTHISGTLVVQANNVLREPSNYTGLVARVEIDDHMYYVQKTALSAYLTEKQLSTQDFVNEMTKKGLLTFTGKKRLAKNWGEFGKAISGVSCFGFKGVIPKDDLFGPDY